MPPVRATTTASAPPAVTRRPPFLWKSESIASGSVAGNFPCSSCVDREGNKPHQASRSRRREFWQCRFPDCGYEGAKKRDVVTHAAEAHLLPPRVEQQEEVAVKAEPEASAPSPAKRPLMPTFSLSPQISTFGRSLSRYAAYREMYKERQLERYRCYKLEDST